MKIKTVSSSWEQLESLPKIPHFKPRKPMFLFSLLIRLLSIPDLFAVRFSYTRTRMEEAGEGPYLILMNHSSFLDLKIASKMLFPHPYGIVSTTDAFVGKSLLMRLIGCIPTQKFVTDVSLVMNLMRLIKKEKLSVLMYPEAGYSFDGRSTRLPERLGGMIKRLGAPVLMIKTDAGAFLRDPLYNGLRLRRVNVSADLACLLTREEIKEKSADELDEILKKAFDFDHFREQKEKGIRITEKTRAIGLERVLYRCSECGAEGKMRGDGVFFSCHACGKKYELGELGEISALDGKTSFSHIPDWFEWQRQCVREELIREEYRLEIPVTVGAICDHKAMYMLGKGTLLHDRYGFCLRSEDGSFEYRQDPYFSYSLNADFFFYEKGDMISIGTKDRLFYCFVEDGVPVTKARLAAEEMYHLPKMEKTRE